MAAVTDGLGTDGGLNGMEGGVKAGTAVTVYTKGCVMLGALGEAPAVSCGVGAGVAAGVPATVGAGVATGVAAVVAAAVGAGVAAGLAVLPVLALEGVPIGVKKKPPGEGGAPDAGLGDAAAGGEAAAGLAGLITGVASGVASGVGRGPV